MRLELLDPAALEALPLALLPAAAVLASRLRARPALAALGLEAAGRRSSAGVALGAAVATALLVVAAARPALVRAAHEPLRTDAQLFVVLDASRSMSARAGPSSPTRLERARAFALRLRASLPEIPVGVASFVDRVLPALMPTGDAAAFGETVQQAIGIDRPPPQSTEPVATDLTDLQQLPEGGSFARSAHRRLIVLLTDGESRPYDPASLIRALRRARTGLLVVRFWAAGERVFAGRRAVSYRPDPASTAPFDALGALSVGGRVFAPGDAAGAAAAALRFFGSGPTAAAPQAEARPVPLGPYAALAGFAGLALLLLRRGGGGTLGIRPRWGRVATRVRRRTAPLGPAAARTTGASPGG